MSSFKVTLGSVGCLVILTAICMAQSIQTPEEKPRAKRGTAAAPGLKLPPTKQASAKADFPVIVHLEKRNEIITVKQGPNGPVYLVTDKSGKIRFNNISEKELQARVPELHQYIKTATVGASQTSASSLDASIRPQPNRSFLDATAK